MDTEPNTATDADGDGAALVRRYYAALDDHEYDVLEELLAPEFTQGRPDRVFESRAEFVRFMREQRPNPDTSHRLEAVVAGENSVAVRGRVLDGDTALFGFADFFDLEDGEIVGLETYSR
ncbi:nuclear transport factor 2 family protein [Natronorubrum sulfidifaciens]|uniref:SnoaL-like domain-containing protein n=1 Tax=Natronorubrum sulfidifaciens JCM 14089 TaxID=1230460 RepID=L9WEB6_9EURY|nr:nuclear transport factor 2 family protein [Natronorubrum sulfidifaciens]ELY47601.1 hypothetical protein C495_05057 [Natronorubrum sulfidifaciens JCM 14089]